MPARECSRTACSEPAVSTLTYVYADSTAVLGPLARSSEPHTYDLCAEHSAGLTVPRGWTAIRIPGASQEVDDLVALAAALSTRPVDPRRGDAGDRRGSAARSEQRPASHRAPEPGTRDGARHLHVIRGGHE